MYDALENGKERNESYNWFDLRDREHTECRLRLTERIQAFEKIQRQISETKTIKSCKSHRSESVASSRSARLLRLEAAAKSSARLRAKMEFYGGRELPLKNRNYKIFLYKFFLYFLKKNHIGMAENCHLKRNNRHGRELPFEKKIHIGMAENCHRKKISYRHGRELPLEKKSYRHGRELPLHTRTVAKTCILQHLNSKKVVHSKILILNVL